MKPVWGTEDLGVRSKSACSSGPRLNSVALLSLFTEPSQPLPEEQNPVEMPFHHCHRDPLPQPGLTPERLQAQRQLCAACAVCCIFMAGEVVGKLESSFSNPILLPPASHSRPRVPGMFLSKAEMQRRGWRGWWGWMPRTQEVGEAEGQHQGGSRATPRARGPGLASQC